MGKSRFGWYHTSPMPSTLEEAKDEIARLRQQLFTQNQQLERMAEKSELRRRSLMGSIKALEQRFNIKVIVDRGLPQGELELKTADGQAIRIVHVGVGEENVNVEDSNKSV